MDASEDSDNFTSWASVRAEARAGLKVGTLRVALFVCLRPVVYNKAKRHCYWKDVGYKTIVWET